MRPRARIGAGLLAGMLCAAAMHGVAAAPEARNPRALLLPPGQTLRIDGRLDEAAWRDAPVHDGFVQYLPVDRQPVPEGYRTTLQVVAEEHALVFAIRAWDPRPQEIRAPLVRRDQVRRDQDFVSVILDPVGDRRSAQFVRISAAGVVTDGMFIADTDNEDFAPDFDVQAAVTQLPDGYSAELRMPLLALRYPFAGGGVWRVMAGRSIPRESSTLLLSAPLSKEALNFIVELQAIEGLDAFVAAARTHALLAVRPELTLRSTRSTGEAGTRRERSAALGVDLKWRPRADWVFDATLNPDFSQVEIDQPQLAGNTRFALSVPEKRPFFLESTDVLDLPLAAFYSRSVTDPAAGLRATWRGARADATGLSLRDDGGGLILLPRAYGTDAALQEQRSQATLLRGRLHGDLGSAGLLLAARDYADGRSNQVGGGDLLWRGGDQLLRLRALASRTSALFDDAGSPRAGAAEAGHQLDLSWRARLPGWNITAEAVRTSPDFRNDNGFVYQAGVQRLQTEIIRRFGEVAVFGQAGFTAYELEGYLWAEQITTLADERHGVAGGELVSRLLHPGVWLVAARNTEAWMQLRLDEQRARSGGTLHRTPGVAASWSSNPADWLPLVKAEATLGRLLDVEADRTGRGAQWLLQARLRGSLPTGWGLESDQQIEQTFVRAPDGSRAFTDTAAQWLGVLHLSASDTLRAVVQASRFVRAEDVAAALVGQRSGTRTFSLVAQRRLGLGAGFSVGATRQRSTPGTAAETELFAKASLVW
jgi:hypothetical protein